MYDLRGIYRGACMECKEECSDFEKVETTPFCGYCGCPATKHKKRKLTLEDTNENFSASNDATGSPVNNQPCEESPLIIENDTPLIIENDTSSSSAMSIYPVEKIACKRLEPSIPDLPEFSKSVKEALECGNLQKSTWDNMVMQTSAHYVDCPFMTTSTSYAVVGRKMFEAYPSIEALGRKPWSKFATALSSKVRKDRMTKKALNTLQNTKDFSNLQSMLVKKNDESTRNFTIGQRTTTSILLRIQVILPPKTSSEIIECQKKVCEEWVKPQPEKALLKFYLRETFSDRTALLQRNTPFDNFLSLYPCFLSVDYFLVEFSIMMGAKAMKELNQKMKEFFEKLQDKLNVPNKYCPLLAAWLTFEKQASIFQTKTIKFEPIIEVTDNHEEFERKVRDVELSQSPCAIVLCRGEDIDDAAILYCGKFISSAPRHILGLMTAIIAVYYSLELNYPVQYVQAMGALGEFVLHHRYYKLGKRAVNVLAKLK